ncbi:MAG: WD40 repeat domain-containing protein [Cyanobacteria bacterium P01_F01_bin.143]
MKQQIITSKRLFKFLDKQQFSEYIRSVTWSPSGDRLSIISAQGELALWQKNQLNFLQLASNSSLDCLGFSADGQLLAAGGQAGIIQIWRLMEQSQTFELIDTLDCGAAWIDSLVWHPQRNLLAFAVNRELKIWDAQSQEISQNLDFEVSSIFNLAWHPQGNFLAASGHGGVQVWQSDNWQQKPYQLQVPGASLDCAWSSDGKYLASGNLDRTISLLNWDNPPPWLMQGFPGKVSQVTWSNDADKPLLAASCQEGVTIWQFDDQSKNWHSNVLQHQKMVQAIAFSPNSAFLASAGNDGELKIWQEKKLIQTLKVKGGFSSLAWHPTGQYLAAGTQNGELTIWQLVSSGKGFGNS